MKNLRTMLAYLAIGSSAALGCAFEMSPEPDTARESPISASPGGDSAQANPDVALYWHQRGKALINLGEAGDLGAFDQAKEALQKCIDTDPNLAECVQLMAIANRPRPGCPACAAPAATIRAPNVSTLKTLPLTLELKTPGPPSVLGSVAAESAPRSAGI